MIVISPTGNRVQAATSIGNSRGWCSYTAVTFDQFDCYVSKFDISNASFNLEEYCETHQLLAGVIDLKW